MAMASLLAGCTGSRDTTDPQVIVVGVRVAPNNLDPRLANDEASTRTAQLMFTSLMDLGADLRPTPKLAERLDNPDPVPTLHTCGTVCASTTATSSRRRT